MNQKNCGESMVAKTVFDWEYFCCYLSGPIDFAHNRGTDWRVEWTNKLISLGFKSYQIFNPCRKPLKNPPFNLDDESKLMHLHKENQDWRKLTDVMSQIVHIDLRLLDKSDLVLVNMPRIGTFETMKLADQFDKSYLQIYNNAGVNYAEHKALQEMNSLFYNAVLKLSQMQTPTYGTIHEIVVARQQRKPVYMVWDGGKKSCSAWLMWLIGEQNVFETVDEMLEHLSSVAKGETAYNAKDWLLLNLE